MEKGKRISLGIRKHAYMEGRLGMKLDSTVCVCVWGGGWGICMVKRTPWPLSLSLLFSLLLSLSLYDDNNKSILLLLFLLPFPYPVSDFLLQISALSLSLISTRFILFTITNWYIRFSLSSTWAGIQYFFF